MTNLNIDMVRPPREAGAARVIDITPSFMTRLIGVTRYMVNGKVPDWFGPREPLPPQAPDEVAGRMFDYMYGSNINYTPKAGEGLSFQTLRTLSKAWDLLRIIIETQKDRLCQLEWNIVMADGSKADARCEEIETWFQMPDMEHTWEEWLRMLMEDQLVVDAACIYPRPKRDGTLYALEPMDGTTIKRLIDDYGRTPDPGPDGKVPAYQQILHGLVASNYNRDQLIYRPRNVATHRIYGFSNVEQLIVTINIALNRDVSTLAYYTDGSTNDLILSVPDGWVPEQIAKFKLWWDSILKGNTAARRGTMFAGSGMKVLNTKDKILTDKMDEWLARKICFAFGMSPQPFIQQNNRAASVSAATQAKEEGLGPQMAWVTNLMNFMLRKYFKETKRKFMFLKDQETDALTRAQVNNLKVRAGAATIDEWRASDGQEPLPDGQGAVPMIYTGTGAIPVDMAISGEALPSAPGEESQSEPLQDGKKKGASGTNRQQGGPSTRTQNKKPPSRTANMTDGRRRVNKSKQQDKRPVTQEEIALGRELTKALRSMGQQLFVGLVNQGMGSEMPGKSLMDADAVLASAPVDAKGLADPIAKAIKKRMEDGYAAATTALGLAKAKPPLASYDATAYAAARAADLVTEIDGTTRALIRSTIVQALEEGWTKEELAKALSEDYAFSAARAATIAATELADALTHVELEAWRESGVVKSIQWVVSDAEGVCAVCEANEEAGPVDLGNIFPSGDDGPPAHPNCRCWHEPITEEE